MNGLTLDTIRLFLHVLGATVWVGGQIVLATLVPTLSAAGAEVPKAAAKAFNTIAWPAFWLCVATGIWNLIALGDGASYIDGFYLALTIKLILVVISGVTAYVHAHASTRRQMAIFGTATGVSAVATLFVGVLLA